MRTDPLAHRIRERRTALALSYRRLAALAEIQSASFVFHIENGDKIPSEEVAARIARALGEDEDLYRAWSRVRRSGDLAGSLAAAQRLLGIPGLLDRRDALAFSDSSTAASAATFVPGARLKVPVIASGLDPGDGIHPSCPVLRHLRLDATAFRGIDRIVRPYAYEVAGDFGRRADFPPGSLAVVNRAPARPRHDETWVVRHGDRVILSRVLWNGNDLLLLPAPGASDFEVMPARDEGALRGMLVGAVAARVDSAGRVAA